MNIIRSGDPIPVVFSKSLFLAGPTPRDGSQAQWRKDAISVLKKRRYDGIVFVPEPFEGNFSEQVDWETKCLNMADCILFWVPRDLEVLPGFTTNVEFGTWMKSGKVVLGAPKEAPKMRYLIYKAEENNIPTSITLSGTVDNALNFIGKGSQRRDGETNVSLFIWNTASFQEWYQNHKRLGNYIEDAHVEWTFRVGPSKNIVFCWVIFAKVYIAAEKRFKENEFVLARPDISVIVAYYNPTPGKLNLNTKILLIKEFRTPAVTADGFIHELPGGSAKKNIPVLQIAHEELHEETGLDIDISRFRVIQSRQLAGTLSAHKAHLYAVDLTKQEMLKMIQDTHTHGVTDDTECTYIEIKTLQEILSDGLLDWSMVGMVLSGLQS